MSSLTATLNPLCCQPWTSGWLAGLYKREDLWRVRSERGNSSGAVCLRHIQAPCITNETPEDCQAVSFLFRSLCLHFRHCLPLCFSLCLSLFRSFSLYLYLFRPHSPLSLFFFLSLSLSLSLFFFTSSRFSFSFYLSRSISLFFSVSDKGSVLRVGSVGDQGHTFESYVFMTPAWALDVSVTFTLDVVTRALRSSAAGLWNLQISI